MNNSDESLYNILRELPKGTSIAYVREANHRLDHNMVAARYVFITSAARTHGLRIEWFQEVQKARTWLGLSLSESVTLTQ